jgi:hypothetical protein
MLIFGGTAAKNQHKRTVLFTIWHQEPRRWRKCYNGGSDCKRQDWIREVRMPSPFPGMDPYREGTEWISVHIELSSALTNLYDALRYDLSLDYDRPPEIPLRETEMR